MYKKYTVCDRLQQILEAIDIIEERCKTFTAPKSSSSLLAA